jgi:ferredoxin-NADP reductase
MANPVKVPAVITSVKPHDKGIYTLVMKPDRRIPRFRAGQFLHLAIDEYDPSGGYWPESRVFSIASSPADEMIELVYSVKGSYTTRMSRELHNGSRVWVKMPYGDFSIESSVKADQDIVLVAGGTGISPYISYLRTISGSSVASKRKVHLIYGIRNREHFLFPDVIESCLSGCPQCTMDLFVEKKNGTVSIVNLTPLDGMISLEHILSSGKRLNNAVYFLSGPPVMIKIFSAGLRSSGIAHENIKIDAWE